MMTFDQISDTLKASQARMKDETPSLAQIGESLKSLSSAFSVSSESTRKCVLAMGGFGFAVEANTLISFECRFNIHRPDLGWGVILMEAKKSASKSTKDVFFFLGEWISLAASRKRLPFEEEK